MTVPPEPAMTYAGHYTTDEEAWAALDAAQRDVAGDMGEEAVEAGWYDIVHAVASQCTKEVGEAMLYRNGFGPAFDYLLNDRS